MGEPAFDVALSFAGEDRAYVHQVATALRDRGIAVFYDEFNTTALWGNDLYLYLDDIYSNECRYVMVFTSASYARGMWTSHERRSIQTRLVTQPDDFVLLVKLDDTPVAGFRSTLAYVSGRRYTPVEVADLVQTKLGGTPIARAPAAIPVPMSEDGLRRVIATRPLGWEHLLFAGTVWREWERLTSKRLDHELGVATTIAGHVAEAELQDFVRTNLDALVVTLSNVETLIGGDRLTWAMGPPGTLGDVNRIQHLGLRLGTVCESILDWAATVRARASAPRHRNALLLLAALSDEPIRQLGGFVESLVVAAGLISEAVAAGNHAPDPIAIHLDLRLPEPAIAELLTAVTEAQS